MRLALVRDGVALPSYADPSYRYRSPLANEFLLSCSLYRHVPTPSNKQRDRIYKTTEMTGVYHTILKFSALGHDIYSTEQVHYTWLRHDLPLWQYALDGFSYPEAKLGFVSQCLYLPPTNKSL